MLMDWVGAWRCKMRAIELDSQIERDGELHLKDLPPQSGQVVHVVIQERTPDDARKDTATDRKRLLKMLDQSMSRQVSDEDHEFWDRLGREQSRLRQEGTSEETVI